MGVINKDSPFKAVLVTKGRKSGKEHSVWLLAVIHNGRVYFSRHRPDGDWFQNALQNSDVFVKYDNTSIQGKAILVKDESLAKKISELKYPGQERAKEQRVALEVTLCE